MKSEAKLQTKILQFLRMNNRFVIKTQGGTPGTPIGTPDIITIDKNGKFMGLEIKRPDGLGKLSPEQKYNADKIIENNGRWYKIDSFERFMEVWND
ncbi:VRR-NUC domain-containing protein [Weissella viridescens]